MNIANPLQIPVVAFELADSEGILRTIVLANSNYDIQNGGGCVRTVAHDPSLTDAYYGDPKSSSLKWASEACFTKSGTDVYFVDPIARSPGRRHCTQWPVTIRIGDKTTSLVVTGPRVWSRNILGSWKLEAPGTCSEVPVRYESVSAVLATTRMYFDTIQLVWDTVVPRPLEG